MRLMRIDSNRCSVSLWVRLFVTDAEIPVQSHTRPNRTRLVGEISSPSWILGISHPLTALGMLETCRKKTMSMAFQILWLEGVAVSSWDG